MTAVIERLGFEVDAIDVFCGWGGSSQGIHAAGATVKAAANHNALAIECHSRNFPKTDHWQADLVDPGSKNYRDPSDLPRARFAWFSPSCTHHSQANAKKVYQRGLQIAMFEDEEWDEQEYVNSERSRVTMSCVLRYVDAKRPDILVVENVLEVTQWGPGKDGSTFKWWMTEVRNLGYEVECCFFNSMFFPPCPQSRDRVYIVCWRKGNRKPDLAYRPPAFCASDSCGGRMVAAVQSWKPATKAWRGMAAWGKYGSQYIYRCPGCRAPVHPASWMAISAIDWSDLGPTLGERKRPVAESTKERIRRAIRKFWYAPPVLLPGPVEAMGAQVEAAHGASVEFKGATARGAEVTIDNGGSPQRYAANRSKLLTEPLPSLTQKNASGMATLAAGIPMRSGRDRSHGMDDPFATIMQSGGYGALMLLVKNNGGVEEAGYRGHHTGLPLGAVTSHPTQSLVALIPNRTNNVGRHPAEGLAPVMTSATQGVIVAAAGNTSERLGQTRARHQSESLFSQTQTNEFAFAALPTFRGCAEVNPGERGVGEPLGTVSAGGIHHSLVTAAWSKINGGPCDTAWHGVDESLNTVTSRDTHGLVLLPWVDQWRSEPALITEQLAVVTTHMRHSLASLEPFEGEITDDLLMQVKFRMLRPDPELRRAMAFGDEYILIGNSSQMTAGLGAAVTPPVASWITTRCMETFWEQDRDRAA